MSAVVALASLGAWIATDGTGPLDGIERLLAPPAHWSVSDYGFHGDAESEKSLSRINTPQRAEAMLHLLDRMTGTADDAVLPDDLDGALEQIRSVAPQLADRQSFRRLDDLARHRRSGDAKTH